MNKIILEDSIYNLNSNEYNIKSKNNITVFNIKNDSNVKLVELNLEDVDTNYTFNIYNNTNIHIDIFDNSKHINRLININIDGENSDVVLNISTISLIENKYVINVFHNKKNSKSSTIIHGVSLDGSKIEIINNGNIIKNSTNSILHQDNKIINIEENNSKIEPNLYIDEYDIEASHGAFIGKFEEDTLFYLKSRGLSEKESYNLLIKGFLLEDFYKYESLSDKLLKIINKYWRWDDEL